MGYNTALRKNLDLYANVVKVRSLPGVTTRHQGIDTVIIREQTEGEYSCLEHQSVPGVVESLKVVTARKSLRSLAVPPPPPGSPGSPSSPSTTPRGRGGAR